MQNQSRGRLDLERNLDEDIDDEDIYFFLI